MLNNSYHTLTMTKTIIVTITIATKLSVTFIILTVTMLVNGNYREGNSSNTSDNSCIHNCTLILQTLCNYRPASGFIIPSFKMSSTIPGFPANTAKCSGVIKSADFAVISALRCSNNLHTSSFPWIQVQCSDVSWEPSRALTFTSLRSSSNSAISLLPRCEA